MFFRRKKKPGKHAGQASADAERDAEAMADAAAQPATGPYDAAEVPNDQLDRVDLGGLQVPTLPGTQLRLESGANGGVTGVLVVDGASGVSITAYAAPRNEDIWDEVCADLRASIERDGGVARTGKGEFGTEIRAELAAGKSKQVVRFVGIQGPRWLVRAVFSGAAGQPDAEVGVLGEVLRALVVVRGDKPMPIKEGLPLRLPAELAESATAGEPEDGDGEGGDAEGGVTGAAEKRSKFAVPMRGIETAEIR